MGAGEECLELVDVGRASVLLPGHSGMHGYVDRLHGLENGDEGLPLVGGFDAETHFYGYLEVREEMKALFDYFGPAQKAGAATCLYLWREWAAEV